MIWVGRLLKKIICTNMIKTKIKKLPGRVYFVEASNGDSTVLIAMDIYYTDGQTVRWFDTVKERVMGIEKVIDKKRGHFVFERAEAEGGGKYTFVPMTLKTYNQKVKKNILVPQEAVDEEEMLKAFEATHKNAW